MEFLETIIYPSSEREIKFRRCLFTYSIKHQIRHFQVVVVQKRAQKCTKKRDAPANWLFFLRNLLFFFMISMPPTSLDLKVPSNYNENNMLIRNVQVANDFFHHFFILLILHFCLGNPNCNRASMPSGLLAWLTTVRKHEYGSLRDCILLRGERLWYIFP